MRIGIIGMGWVGSSVAISVLHDGIASELWLNDLNMDLAEGEAMDLAHGASFYPSCAVRTATVEEMAQHADAIVVAAGRGGRPGESRLELLTETAAIAADIAGRLRGTRGIVVVVSNPVDVLTRVMVEQGLDPRRVIGTGTTLDTARLRQILGQRLALDPRSIHAHVVGEHGDSQVVLFSRAVVGAVPLRSWPGWRQENEPEIAQTVRRAAQQIIVRKGATNHAIGLVTAKVLGWSLRGTRRVITVSHVLQDGPFAGIALSLPTVVGRDGVDQVLAPTLEPAEEAALQRSAAVLEDAFRSIPASG